MKDTLAKPRVALFAVAFPFVSHQIAPDDLVSTHEQGAANERPPLLVLDPLRAFLDEHGLGSGEVESSRSARGTPTSPTCCAARAWR